MDRRDFLRLASLVALAPARCLSSRPQEGFWVNDIHSKLNRTRVAEIVTPRNDHEVAQMIRAASRQGRSISLAGGRHAMGGQQFGDNTVLLDARSLSAIRSLDPDRGILDVGAGAQWPEIIGELVRLQAGKQNTWGVAQKQTGADRLTIGGALAANAHGRGLKMKPIISDVDSFELIDPRGELLRCSRTENGELFRLAIGGYGLFGVITSVRLRLTARTKVERIVTLETIDRLPQAFAKRIADESVYGDFQFSIDEDSDSYLREGILSTYRPVDPGSPINPAQQELQASDWEALIYLAHEDEREAYRRYTSYYLGTTGQIYWSDEHQLSVYLDDYHTLLDARLKATASASEMITEIYVPRNRLVDFLEESRKDFLANGVNVIYGTIRLIERDDESFLTWAREPWACTIFNLHVEHTPQGIEHAANAFRRLIDAAIVRGGSYYLTYHRWATREQVESSYPNFFEFLAMKRRYDPRELFQSEWYRHYRKIFDG